MQLLYSRIPLKLCQKTASPSHATVFETVERGSIYVQQLSPIGQVVQEATISFGSRFISSTRPQDLGTCEETTVSVESHIGRAAQEFRGNHPFVQVRTPSGNILNLRRLGSNIWPILKRIWCWLVSPKPRAWIDPLSDPRGMRICLGLLGVERP